MPEYYGNDRQPHRFLPDLPGDPYGRDNDLYPPVQDSSSFDYFEASTLEADFRNQTTPGDLVVGSRFSELPSQSNVIPAPVPSRPRRGDRLRDARSERQQMASQERMEIVYDIDKVVTPKPAPAPSVRRKPSRRDRVVDTSVQMSAVTADTVTEVAPSQPRPTHHRHSNGAWGWSPMVLPSFRQVLEQIVPTAVMAFSLLFGIVTIERLPFLEGIWALIVLTPSVLLYFLADGVVHPLWRRWALINLASVGVFYPLLIVRQSYLRVPFVGWGNGTLTMPLISTLAVVVLLVALALAAAWMSQDDPEYAGILFLPTAMLVPFFAGATEIVSLRTALIIAAIVYIVSGVLTVVASMLPGSYPMLVAPIAIAIEFLVLPLSDSVPIFPTGAGAASKLLFFVVLAVTVGLTIAMPNLAAWVRSVRDLVRYGEEQSPTVRLRMRT